jgi:predicted nuclease of predicted toxin-antitoxin system
LIWDEQLSHPVARALRELGFNTTYVGAPDHGVPPKSSTDGEVIAYALRTNQVIVTSNHDMMLLCDEAAQRFVWIDPRGRRLRREEQVMLCFGQIARWEEILASGSCVRAMRSKAVPIGSAEAARLAAQRFRALHRRKRITAKHRADHELASLTDWQQSEGGDDQTTSAK